MKASPCCTNTTASNLPNLSTFAIQEAKEKRRKVLEEVRARRKEIYKRFRERMKQAYKTTEEYQEYQDTCF